MYVARTIGNYKFNRRKLRYIVKSFLYQKKIHFLGSIIFLESGRIIFRVEPMERDWGSYSDRGFNQTKFMVCLETPHQDLERVIEAWILWDPSSRQPTMEWHVDDNIIFYFSSQWNEKGTWVKTKMTNQGESLIEHEYTSIFLFYFCLIREKWNKKWKRYLKIVTRHFTT